MKLSNLILIVLFVGASTISCDQEASPPNETEILVQKTIQSSHFTNLEIPVSSLDIRSAQILNPAKDAIYIPLKGFGDEKGIIGLFEKNQSPRGAMFYEVITEFPTELVEAKMKEGVFNGSFIFKTEFGTIESHLEKSKVVSTRKTPNVRSGVEAPPEPSCAGWSEPGGPLDCAGARLVQMNPPEKILCYANFIPCMAALAASCWWDDCVVNPNHS